MQSCRSILLLVLCLPTHSYTLIHHRSPFSCSNEARSSPSPRLSCPIGRRPRRAAKLCASSRVRSANNNGGDGPIGSTGSSETTEMLSEERRASLLQFLLRDLQVEGVPLLSVDVVEAAADDNPRLSHAILQAALWTTLAELADQQRQERQVEGQDENDDAGAAVVNKACLVFDHVPVPDLERLVDHFEDTLKRDERVASTFPGIRKVRLSLVGKGIGPALLMEAADTTSAATTANNPSSATPWSPEREQRTRAAMKMFVDRTGIVRGASSANEGGADEPLQYRVCTFRDAFHIHGAFWNCVCEVLQSSAPSSSPSRQRPPQLLSPTFLLLPELDDDSSSDENQQRRFDALTSMLTQSLELFGNDATNDTKVEVSYYSPTYDRSKIPGHLPPLSWLTNEDDGGDDASLWNYQRRSPVTACLLRCRTGSPAMALTATSAQEGDADSSRRVLSSRIRWEQTRLVHQTLEQATGAERDVATGK